MIIIQTILFKKINHIQNTRICEAYFEIQKIVGFFTQREFFTPLRVGQSIV